MKTFITVGENLLRASRIRRIEKTIYNDKWRLHIYSDGYNDDRPEHIDFDTKELRNEAFTSASLELNTP